MTQMLEAALEYAARNWLTFPLHTIRNGRCSCGTSCKSPGKHPITPDGFYSATTDPETIRGWWSVNPDANIGIRTGVDSNLWVIDQDNKRSVEITPGSGLYMPEGTNSIRKAEQMVGETLPDTLCQVTGSGGRHYLYAYPNDGREYSNVGGLMPSVDIRGEGGYIVAAPSIHESGQRYSWANPETAVSDAPLWFAGFQRERKAEPFELRQGVVEGERNTYLTSYAGKLWAEGRNPEDLRTMVMGHNQMVCQPPMDAGEVIQICQSVMRYPQGRPDIGVIWDLDENGNPIASTTETDLQPSQVAISLYDLIVHPPEPKQPLVYEGLLDRGDGFIIAGESGVGKSWLAFDLALAIASGEQWLGQFATSQGGVLYIDEEGSRSGMYRRMRMLMAGRGLDEPDLPLHMVIRKSLKFDSNEGFSTISRLIWEYEPSIVIADTLVRMHTGEENSAKDMAKFFDLSSRLREAYGCAIGFIHHVRKPAKDNQGAQIVDSMRGSGDIRGWPDSIIVAQKSDPGIMKITHAKSREHAELHPFDLALRINDDGAMPTAHFEYQGKHDATPAVTVEDKRNMIVQVINAQQTQGPVTSALIAATLNLAVRTVEDHLKPLVTEKKVTEIKNAKNPATYVAGQYQATSF